MSPTTTPPKPPYEVNFPAHILMLIDGQRHLENPLDLARVVKLLLAIEKEAHMAGLQLQSINAGAPLNSIEIAAQYAEGWRFTGKGPAKIGEPDAR